MKFLVLLLCLGRAVRADELEPPAGSAVKAARLFLKDDTTVDVGEGCYLNKSGCLLAGQRLESLRAENDSLKKSLDSIPPSLDWKFVLGAIVTAAGVGFAAAKLVK